MKEGDAFQKIIKEKINDIQDYNILTDIILWTLLGFLYYKGNTLLYKEFLKLSVICLFLKHVFVVISESPKLSSNIILCCIIILLLIKSNYNLICIILYIFFYSATNIENSTVSNLLTGSLIYFIYGLTQSQQ